MLSTEWKNPETEETLKLTITDKDTSDPLVASVTIGEETKDSGIDGVVQFTLAYGDYEATIECEGYTTATEELAFRSNHKNFTVELEAAAPVVTSYSFNSYEAETGGESLFNGTFEPTGETYTHETYGELEEYEYLTCSDAQLVGEKIWLTGDAVSDGTTRNQSYAYTGASYAPDVYIAFSPVQ